MIHNENSRARILLVTGIHQEELAFGDKVTALLSDQGIEVMRIPNGISHSMKNADDQFYYNTRHQEIYLQLSQQVEKFYHLLIDLHCGVNTPGHCSDLYCANESLMLWLETHAQNFIDRQQLRLIRIIDQSNQAAYDNRYLHAHTLIPEKVWNNSEFIYLGLEIYLDEEGEGVEADWLLARELIELLQEVNVH